MANKDRKNGFMPVNFPQGEQRRLLTIEPSTTTELRIGDPGVRLAGNTLARATAGAGNPIAGVVDEIFDNTGVPQEYYPATTPAKTGWKCHILIHIDQEYEVQESNGAAGNVIMGAAAVGKNVNLVFGTLPDAEFHPKSQAMIDSDSVGTGATLQFRIVDICHRTDNDPTAINARYAVKTNNNQEETGAGI